MPFYHALLKNNPSKETEASYYTDGAEYIGPFTEEMITEKFPANEKPSIVVIHFFDSEEELIAYHNRGSWKQYME